MGCDIHVYTERKHHSGKWVNCDYYALDTYDLVKEEKKAYEIRSVYDERNYQLFSILADVRNSFGIIPISKPKGLPEDMCIATKEAYKHWEHDGHSCSYFTLRELLDSRCKYEESPFLTLCHFIQKLTDHFTREVWAYNDEEFKKRSNDFRVVFWFDN